MPPGTSVQLAVLTALTLVLELGKGKRVAIYTNSKYLFLGLHGHVVIWNARGHLTTQGFPIKYGDQILRLLGAVHLLTKVSVSHCKGHQKRSMEVILGNQTANQAAKRAALQNNNLIRVATFVPQANLPETPSCMEGDTLKTKSEGFQDHMGWLHKEGLLFLPGNLQWKLVNSLHATTHLGQKALQRLVERSFTGTDLQTTIRQVVFSCPKETTGIWTSPRCQFLKGINTY